MKLLCGAGNANKFKAAVRIGTPSLPPPSSLTYQGLFNHHTFFAGGPEETAAVALAARAGRVPTNSGADAGEDIWVGCFLKSCTDGRPRDATPIDIVAVLDISGSMDSVMRTEESGDSPKSRLAFAQDALLRLLEQLREDDRFGLATFTSEGTVVQPLEFVRNLNFTELQKRISDLRAGGGTTIAAGMDAAVGICKGAAEPGGTRHHRLLFLTDMDDMRAQALSTMVQCQAKSSIYVSFVGIGVGFNSELAEEVTKHPGANYFCITRAEELKKVVVDDFAFNFFPVAFDVEVAQQSDAFDLVAVYGTPFDTCQEAVMEDWQPSTHRIYPAEAKENFKELLLCAKRSRGVLPSPALQQIFSLVSSPSTRTVIRADTVFPSAVAADGSIEGGLLLLRLRPKRAGADTGTVRLLMKYTAAADSTEHSGMVDVDIPSATAEVDPALAKGVMLQRYVEACQLYLTVAKEKPDATGRALESALQGVESLVEDFNADQGSIDRLCPGVRQELLNFAKMAQKHYDSCKPAAAAAADPVGSAEQAASTTLPAAKQARCAGSENTSAPSAPAEATTAAAGA